MSQTNSASVDVRFYVRSLNRLVHVIPRIMLGWCKDLQLGIKTTSFDFFDAPDIIETEAADAHMYAPARYRTIASLLAMTPMGSEDVFYDIGVGMGRVACVAAQLPVKKVVGVEYSADLCTIARRNIQNLRGRISPVDIIEADAGALEYLDGTVFWLFNPFGDVTMARFLGQVQQSLRTHPRRIRIILLNAQTAHVFEACDWLTPGAPVPDMPEGAVRIWEHRA